MGRDIVTRSDKVTIKTYLTLALLLGGGTFLITWLLLRLLMMGGC